MIGINVSITMASFVLCGLLFVMSVGLLVGKYVNHDLDFLLMEVSENLNTKISYMENVIYDIRDSDELMQYLKEPFGSPKKDTELLFQKEVNISSDKNQGDTGRPVVDKICLFGSDGQSLSAYYYAMIYSEVNESSRRFRELYDTFAREKEADHTTESSCYRLDDVMYIAYTLFDDDMADCGTVLYEVNLDAVNSIMKEMEGYKRALWLLYDDEEIIDGSEAESMEECFQKVKDTHKYEPYVLKIGNTSYRMYNRELCMNLNVAVGVPENQAMFVLYDSLHIYIAGIVMVLLAGVVSFAVFTYKVTKPIKEVTAKMSRVQKGEFDTKLPDYDNEEFHEISQVFNEMTEYINHLVNEVYEKQISIKEMELKFLQTQMNPHFMFNVLNSIALQARMEGNEDMFRMIYSFSQLIQAKIYRSGREKVQIRQELEYVEYYLYLQNFRYGDRLAYRIEVEDEALLDLYIPKLCIQLIVENAVVHGIEPKLSKGLVDVRMYEENQSIYIEITDNGVGFEEEGEIRLPIEKQQEDKAHNHVGLNNVHHIIRLMYGDVYGITIYSTHSEGTKVSIHIPFDYGSGEEEEDAVSSDAG